MPTQPPLEIYILNVGMGDTSVIKTPGAQTIIIDAYRPKKLKQLLSEITENNKVISLLIITHPHRDHYNAVQSLINEYDVKKVVLSPFWYYHGTPGYHAIMNMIQAKSIPVRFLSGYERIYPDMISLPGIDNSVSLELIGPSNNLQERLFNINKLEVNHLSIMARLEYGRFSMVFAADAQMENWAHFDSENMLKRCNILKAAHHGSKNGTQWERLEILSPQYVIVSSDPDISYRLPDLIGCNFFK